jgi:ankyrin repeat protein
LTAPLTWGVFHTVVLLPATAALWSNQDKKNALMHEFAHIERNDWLMQMLARLITALYWFNPLVWIAQRQLVLEAELAADDRVLQSGAVPDDYAEQLVTLTRCARRTSLPLAATTMAERSMLSRRVHSILNSGEKKVTLNQLSKYALICTVSAMAMLVGSVELVAAPQENSARVRTTLDIPDDISTPLIRAAAEGKNDEVLRLLQSGADVNETSENRGSKPQLPRSALTAAAEQGHLQVVQTLVDAGAPVDRVVRGDGTALIAATRRNHFEVTKYLLDRGADANLAVRGDGSPLIAATAANNTDAVRLLLERGADPDLSVRGDENPLYHAAANGNDEIMQMLIDAGVDLNQEWEGDGTALIVATRQGNASAAETLMLAGARADQGVRGDGNAMIVASQRGDTALLQKMVASGADVNAAVKGDGSPLIQAARNGHMESVVLLLQAGADIDMVVAGDENALIGAAWRGDVEMVDYLLRSGANPNIKAESYGETRTALRQAMLEEHEEVIRLLRAAGAKE